MKRNNHDIAVLIPCYNESITIAKVVDDFKAVLPGARIYVYDNNSSDGSDEIARSHGAIVYYEPNQGKGCVIRSMFREIDAKYYLMVDGDDTYPADECLKLFDEMDKYHADMVIGDRLSNGTYTSENKRPFHNFGNNLVKNLINQLFDGHIADIMTGYRLFNKRFVKSMPLMSNGFEIETEMNIFALSNHLKIREVPITYRDRPEGSFSKLNTFSDGFKVLLTIFNLMRDYKPLYFFTVLSIFLVLVGLLVGLPVISEFIETAYVSKVPSAILASSLMIIAVLLFNTGLNLDYSKNTQLKMIAMQLNKFPLEEDE